VNLTTVAENLRNTIAGKVKHLAEQQMNRHSEDAYVRTAAFTVEKMLEINIAELQRILQDVEQCEQFNNYEKWDGDE
jgi:hypothetical protein